MQYYCFTTLLKKAIKTLKIIIVYVRYVRKLYFSKSNLKKVRFEGHSNPSLIGFEHMFWHTQWSPFAITSFSFKEQFSVCSQARWFFQEIIYFTRQATSVTWDLFTSFSTGVVYTTYDHFFIMAGWKLKTVIATIVTVFAVPYILHKHSKCNLSSVINQLVSAGDSRASLCCAEWFVTSFPGSLGLSFPALQSQREAIAQTSERKRESEIAEVE